MKTTLLIGLMSVVLLAGAASGQQKVSELVLQDDTSGNFLVIDLGSGNYRVQSCQQLGDVLAGVAKVDISGCRISIQDIQKSRLVLASIDGCSGAASASISVEIPCMRIGDCPKQTKTIQDSDIKDSTPECRK